MGLYMQVWRKGDVSGATIMGVVLLFLCILSGPWVASHPEYFGFLDIDKPEMSLLIPIYGFFASVLPVWLLLLPRDYLSTFLKIGTIGALLAAQPLMQAALPGALDWAGTGLRQLAHHTSFYTLANRAALGERLHHVSCSQTAQCHTRCSETAQFGGRPRGHWLTKIPLGTPFDNVFATFLCRAPPGA
jgi:hypothetical protein